MTNSIHENENVYIYIYIHVFMNLLCNLEAIHPEHDPEVWLGMTSLAKGIVNFKADQQKEYKFQ